MSGFYALFNIAIDVFICVVSTLSVPDVDRCCLFFCEGTFSSLATHPLLDSKIADQFAGKLVSDLALSVNP